jgi:hypothetical protein
MRDQVPPATSVIPAPIALIVVITYNDIHCRTGHLEWHLGNFNRGIHRRTDHRTDAGTQPKAKQQH